MADVDVPNIISYKRLVAVGNDDVYYEDIDVAVGTMKELTTTAVGGQSSGPIDTSDNLNMFELLQKVFVVNGAKLRVADFVNTKIVVSAMTVNRVPAHGDILTQVQNGSDIAYMVVDFVNTARTVIYGYAYYAGTATAFIDSADISSNDATGSMDPNPIPHANISTITTKPHWYDWTAYPAITLSVAGYGQDAGSTKSFGSMPNKAYLGCNYRGRAVLSGDPEHPHQWYMVRQTNPWDWAYIANDAQSPVKGGNADAGEIGDIIRALIPYKDDYLIFGCATSMWFIAGDPAEGGSLNELDLTVGMFGANSWCFDGKGNLYFWGTNGIYKTTIPGTPECISEIRLPKLIKDELIDPATHRITMIYDRIRAGILTCITKIADGTNSNYWYDLRTEGFFPESYQEECGAYSLFHYGANNYAYRDLLIGCKDGYIRKFNEVLKNDNDTGDNPAVGTKIIDSHVSFGPLQIASDPKLRGNITELDLITAGGSTGSNDVDCKIYVGNDAEGIVTRLEAGSTPNLLKTLKSPGRQQGNTIRQKLNGVYAGVQLRNNTVDETWGFEQLLVGAKQTGRVK